MLGRMILTRESYASTIAGRVGFVPLDEVPLSAPHYADAKDLDKVLRAMDADLRVGFIFDPQDRRKDRWGVMRFTMDGGQQLIRIVQDKDQNYQPPDQRVFLDLQKHRLGGPNGRFWIQEALNQEERLLAAQEKAKEEERAEMRVRAAKHVRDIRFKGKQGQTVF